MGKLKKKKRYAEGEKNNNVIFESFKHIIISPKMLICICLNTRLCFKWQLYSLVLTVIM